MAGRLLLRQIMKENPVVTILTIGLNKPQTVDPRFIAEIDTVDAIFVFPPSLTPTFKQIMPLYAKLKKTRQHDFADMAAYMKEVIQDGGHYALIVPDLPNMGKYAGGVLQSLLPETRVSIRHFCSRGVLEDAIMKFEIEAGTTICVRDISQPRRFESNPLNPDEVTLVFSITGIKSIKQYVIDLQRFLPEKQNLLGLKYKKELGWTRVEMSSTKFAASEDDSFFPLICFPVTMPNATLNAFAETIARLRAPDGCPWDREQTHSSLRTNLLEETYEALAALDEGDVMHLREELGDVLLQIVLHAQIAFESGEFTLTDVIEGINSKIVSRHPHVFEDLALADAESVIRNWEKIKRKEREEFRSAEEQGMLNSIPRILPALSLAQKYQERAARVGFDWDNLAPVLEKIHEEIREVQGASNQPEIEKELGDLLFAIVNLARWLNVDAESALRGMTLRFKERFEYIESHAKAQGRVLNEMTLKEMDALWEKAKANEKS